MKVLLTGAAGLIGMALHPMLAKRGHKVWPTRSQPLPVPMKRRVFIGGK